MWIKICGNTSLLDAQMCAQAGADAVGFVFARGSKRMVNPRQVAPISHQLAQEFPHVERVGVFIEGPASTIAAAVNLCELTTVQLQGDDALMEAQALRGFLPGARIIAAFGWAGVADFDLRLLNSSYHAVLVDSGAVKSGSEPGGRRKSGPRGGTGSVFAWEEAAGCFSDARSRGVSVIAAGGLTPENVTIAVTVLHPWGVDVASGVESAPGVKDPAKVARFIAATREA
jgi:phosphoribosylanthranilate isomerase